MEDNSLLMIILAFVLGCMCSQMMKQMCGGRLVEGSGHYDSGEYYDIIDGAREHMQDCADCIATQGCDREERLVNNCIGDNPTYPCYYSNMTNNGVLGYNSIKDTQCVH